MKNTLAVYAESKESVMMRADKILAAYSEHFLHGDECATDVEVETDTVEIIWEATWSYGGHDSGSVSVPEKAFQGDWSTWVEEEIKQDILKKKLAVAKDKKRVKAKKRRELKRLQKKYGDKT